MEEALRRILHGYLGGTVSFDGMTDWVARNIWDAPNVENSLVDQVAHLLAFLDDNLLSEDDFREEVRSLLSIIVLEVDLSIGGTDLTVRTDPPEKTRLMEEEQVAA